MAKEGSTISGFADAFAQAISYALQYGVPLQDLVDKFSHVRFEPSGMTKNPDIRFAKSIVDYIFRWLAVKFLSHGGAVPRRREQPRRDDDAGAAGPGCRRRALRALRVAACDVRSAGSAGCERRLGSSGVRAKSTFAAIQNQEDAPPCSTCGSIMVRSGACYKCATAARRQAAPDGRRAEEGKRQNLELKTQKLERRTRNWGGGGNPPPLSISPAGARGDAD